MLTLNVGKNGVPFSPTSKKVVLRVGGTQIASLSVIQDFPNCTTIDDQGHWHELINRQIRPPALFDLLPVRLPQ